MSTETLPLSVSVSEAWARCILHADLDAFYASVEQLDSAALRGKPVLVGGSPQGRGVVAACSYEARKFGVRSAMPMRTAVALCPEAVVVRPRFARYAELSRQVHAIFERLTSLVEPMSLDEAYLDLSERTRQGTAPVEIGRRLKQDVRQTTGLVVSVGIGTSKSVAKIASDEGKPDGLVLVTPGEEAAFLAPLPVRRLHGVGPTTEAVLRSAGIETIGDLAAKSEAWLARRFGHRGAELASLARGIDHRPVSTDRETKSISAETTFSRDIGDRAELHRHLEHLAARVAERMQEAGLTARTVTVKLRLSDFTTFTRSATSPVAFNERSAIVQQAGQVLDRELSPGRKFRLVGVGVSGLAQERQPRLFEL